MAITSDDVSGGASGKMLFIGSPQGGAAQVPAATNAIAALGTVKDLNLDDFPAGATQEAGRGKKGSLALDQHESKVKGGLSLDDPHGPKSVEGVLKPNGQ